MGGHPPGLPGPAQHGDKSPLFLSASLLELRLLISRFLVLDRGFLICAGPRASGFGLNFAIVSLGLPFADVIPWNFSVSIVAQAGSTLHMCATGSDDCRTATNIAASVGNVL